MGERCFRMIGWGVFILLTSCCFATSALAWGEVTLVDESSLEWFFNTDITNTTVPDSASGAASEAGFAAPVSASTSAGGWSTYTINDAFDGYNALCLSTTGATGPCAFGDANYIMYNNNGAGAFDPDSGGRQFEINPQVMGDLTVARKFYVPDDDSFARWLNIVTNNGLFDITFNLIVSGNLGSDIDTVIFDTSNGNLVAETTDNWVATMSGFTGPTSPDPRLGHVLKSNNAPVGLADIHIADGEGQLWWTYQLTLSPGQTKIIMNFATGQTTRDRVRGKAQDLVSGALNNAALRYMTNTELAQVVNFSDRALADQNEDGGGGCFIDNARAAE